MKSVRENIGGLGNLMFKQAYLIAKFFEGEIPDVYVQDTKYFAPYEKEIKASFAEGIPPRTNKVAIHIRRGDYLKAGHFHTNLWEHTDYYQRAIALFPNEDFIIFCKDNQGWEQDKADREWCRQNIGPLTNNRYELPPKENTETQDLNLMASCKAIIMANSTFSWWAAYLNPNPDKQIICPKDSDWFVDGMQRISLLEEWKKI